MARVALARPCDQTRVFHEIVAVEVVRVAVAVGIAADVERLAFVPPHVGLEVGMVIGYTLVEHGDDDRGVARGHLPSLRAVDVAAGDDGCGGVVRLERIVARIVVVPLVLECGVGLEGQP